MEIMDLMGACEFSPTEHVQKFLAESPHSSVSIACWEAGQTGPIHSHPGADEIYYVLEGKGFFRDGRMERQIGPGLTVFFRAGEAHQVGSLTRTVLYRVQAGADRHPKVMEDWP